MDDEFSITGTGTTTNSNNVSRSHTILIALVKKTICENIVSGRIRFDGPNHTAVLDYGDGTCDGLATFHRWWHPGPSFLDNKPQLLIIKRRSFPAAFLFEYGPIKEAGTVYLQTELNTSLHTWITQLSIRSGSDLPQPNGRSSPRRRQNGIIQLSFARKTRRKIHCKNRGYGSDTFVEGAEQYIYDCLDWCGLIPDESPIHGGEFGPPYRQSERKALYRKYAEQLIGQGMAYYAFDTPAELDAMRQQYKTEENPSPQYDGQLRGKMKTPSRYQKKKTEKYLQEGVPHVIRIKMPEHETISFQDMIHGEVSFDSSVVDDKVLLKADGCQPITWPLWWMIT